MALTVAHNLAKHGVEVIGSDSLDLTLLKFSKYTHEHFLYTDPAESEEKFIDDLEKNIIKFKPNDTHVKYVLMPIHNETMVIAKHKDRLSKNILVACPDYETLSKVFSKDDFARQAKLSRIKTPLTFNVNNGTELNSFKDDYCFPAMIKPLSETGGRGISKVENFVELEHAYHDIQSSQEQTVVVQEYVTGEDYCVAAIFDRGNLKAHMAYTNIYTYPEESGAGCLRETVDDQAFYEDIKKIGQDLNWHGIVQFDFMWDKKHKPYMIEINPRFWGGIFQSIESDIEFPWLLLKLTLGEELADDITASIGTQSKIPLLWMVPALQDAIQTDDQLAELKSLVESDQGFLSNLFNFGKYLLNQDVSRSFENIKKVFNEYKESEDEFFLKDDPKAILGVLYVVSSLQKNGELPMEVKFE